MRSALALLFLTAATPATADVGEDAFLFATGLEARLGRPDGPVLPAGTLTCAGCHGPDGNGGVEGGLQPAPPIRWQILGTPTPDRPAYDDASLQQLLEKGITPSGREISARMPRFQAAPEVFRALADYLRGLDETEQQGLEPDRLIIGLPSDPALHTAATAAMQAFNEEGGAFGRIAVAGPAAFAELDDVLAELRPRISQAERARLQSLLRAQPELQQFDGSIEASDTLRVAGTLDQLGPHLGQLLSLPNAQVVVVAPSAEAMEWAVKNKQDGASAHAFTATRSGLELLREYGRNPTRTRFLEDLDQIDVNELIDVYRHPAMP